MTKTVASKQYVDVSESDRPPGPGLETFDDVYERELDYVFRILGRLGVPAADVPDATHDVFVLLYRKRHELDPERPLRQWLFGVARKIAAARRRKRRELLEAGPEASNGAGEQLSGRDLLWRALATLDEDRRIAIVLHDLEGHTGAEIAKQLDISVNTVHSRIRLGRADLAVAVRRLRGQP